MDRRRFLLTSLAGAVMTPLATEAQPAGKVPRVGVLFASTPAATAKNKEGFTQGLRERGYVEGKYVLVERRYVETQIERIAQNAAELVRMRVDVIVAVTDPVIAAAKRHTGAPPSTSPDTLTPSWAGQRGNRRPGAQCSGR